MSIPAPSLLHDSCTFSSHTMNSLVVTVDHILSGLVTRVTVDAAVLIAAHVHVVLQNIQHTSLLIGEKGGGERRRGDGSERSQ